MKFFSLLVEKALELERVPWQSERNYLTTLALIEVLCDRTDKSTFS